jgi:hypothetical protein
VCWLQWISVHYRKGVVYSESIIRCWNCIVCSESMIHYRKCVFRIEFVILCWNWVVCSELTFATKKVLVAVGQRWLPKGCCLQRVSVRCWKCVFCSEFVIRCWNWVVCNELTFAVESVLATTSQRSLLKGCFQIELSTANEHSLLKVCWLQQTSFRCQIM